MDTIGEEWIDNSNKVGEEYVLLTKCLTFDKIPTVFDSFKQSSMTFKCQVRIKYYAWKVPNSQNLIG